MRVRILGGGWYGCHLALSLLKAGCDVQLQETAGHLFAGASGGNPARLHLGFHYPRSRMTRAACQDHHRDFMDRYGHLTRTIPVNIYAVAQDLSHVDWGTYKQVLRNEVDFIELERPADLGLRNVEGALLTGERHIVIGLARGYFEEQLRGHVIFDVDPEQMLEDTSRWDWTIDCTFCARDGHRIDRYEVCVTGLLKYRSVGPMPSVTIMDGPFPSIYAWDPDDRLASITSALLTPIGRFANYRDAAAYRDSVDRSYAVARVEEMRQQMARYWPESLDLYEHDASEPLVRIRAMPLSGADARLVDIVDVGERLLRVRAGKIDAITHAERLVKERLWPGR